MLDKLMGGIATLSSVYYKPADLFVKRVRDRINERLDQESEGLEVAQKTEYVDSTGVSKSEYIKQAVVQSTTSYTADLLDILADDGNKSKASAIDDLLGGTAVQQVKKTSPIDDLLGLGSSSEQPSS